MFGGLTHRPATELAKLLVENSPEGLTQVWLLADLLGLGWGGWLVHRSWKVITHVSVRNLWSIWLRLVVFARHLVPRRGIPFETCLSVQPWQKTGPKKSWKSIAPNRFCSKWSKLCFWGASFEMSAWLPCKNTRCCFQTAIIYRFTHWVPFPGWRLKIVQLFGNHDLTGPPTRHNGRKSQPAKSLRCFCVTLAVWALRWLSRCHYSIGQCYLAHPGGHTFNWGPPFCCIPSSQTIKKGNSIYFRPFLPNSSSPLGVFFPPGRFAEAR